MTRSLRDTESRDDTSPFGFQNSTNTLCFSICLYSRRFRVRETLKSHVIHDDKFSVQFYDITPLLLFMFSNWERKREQMAAEHGLPYVFGTCLGVMTC